MPKAKKPVTSDSKPIRRRPEDPDARENYLISLAMNCAEQRLIDGTASPSEVVHFLKLGSSRAELEREKLEAENNLARAKVEALESTKRIEELYSNAIKAMKGYSGQTDASDEEDDYQEV